MDWLDRMNEALDYIEGNLAGTIDTALAARGACCSEYHFTRMFSFITGVPLSEYIRRRRLTLAGFELKHSDCKVIDLALKYGYDSPGAFTRAFQSLHGVTPTEARTPHVQLKSFARISFTITIKGETSMQYHITEKEAFTVFGRSIPVTAVDGQCFRDIPDFWARSEADGTTLRIAQAAGLDRLAMLSSVMYAHETNGAFRYMICADAPAGGVPDGFESVEVPAQTWAIFPTGAMADTTTAIHGIWQRIHPEWFPSSGYEHANAPDMERSHRTADGRFICEAWVPIIRAENP